MKSEYLISICIPSYNRPVELKRLLESIDSTKPELIQIVVCEDKAPKRQEVASVVTLFQNTTVYDLRYIENETNLGYDKNLRQLINYANGEYIMFMGDDDMFVPEALDKYIDFLQEHHHCGYILRSYRSLYKDGSVQYFR